MQLGHVLTRSGLTCPEASSKLCHDSFCQSDSSVSLPWVIYCEAFCLHGGSGSSVGIATGYGAGRSGNRIPVGARFSAPVQTGPGAHQTSCTTGTGSFPGVETGRGVTLTPHPLLVTRSIKRVGLYRYSP
jgi:hypothetical protein